jgi:ketosteroid isomerase-like protein
VILTPAERRRAVHQVTDKLEAFHQAASDADAEAYFAHFAEEGVFLGTDATERWSVAQFRAYAEPHFASGRGWTYTSTQRNVSVSDDGSFAWFDELLASTKLGTCRGSGVLRLDQDGWRILHYSLTLPVPNELALQIAKTIRAHEVHERLEGQ